MQPLQLFVSSANMEMQDPSVSNLDPVRFYQDTKQSFVGPLILCSHFALRLSSRTVIGCPWSRSLHIPRSYHTNFLCCKRMD